MGLGNSGSGSAEGNIGNSSAGDSQGGFSNVSADSGIDEALFADSLGFDSSDLSGANADLAMANDSSLLVQSLDDAGELPANNSESNLADISVQNQEGAQTAQSTDSRVQEIAVAANNELMLPDVSFEMESAPESKIAGDSNISESYESQTDSQLTQESNSMERIAEISPTAYEHLLTLEDRLPSPETV